MQTVWLAAALCCAACLGASADEAWVDARALTVEGLGWPTGDGNYARLPPHARSVVPDGVWNLSQHSAGVAVRFVTAAPAVSVRWTLTSAALDMPHMPATGVSGIDLYVRDRKGGWRFAANGRPGPGTQSTATLAVGGDGAHARECLLYLPLYNGVSSLQLAVEAPHHLEPAPPRRGDAARPIVIYGTSIVQGGCASRPGTAWASIAGRRLEREVINLGFSGSGQMEGAVIDLLTELDPAVFVLDCLWNMGGLPEQEQRARIEYAARTLRRVRPRTPIVFVGTWPDFQGAGRPGEAIQADTVRRLRREGVVGLWVAPGARLMGVDGDGTVDGVHPTDLGMMRQALALEPALRRALGARP